MHWGNSPWIYQGPTRKIEKEISTCVDTLKKIQKAYTESKNFEQSKLVEEVITLLKNDWPLNDGH